MHGHMWESKEIAGFFFFRSELSDSLDQAELEQLLKYFMAAHELWTKCFAIKLQSAPIFRFKTSSTNPTHLRIQMLRTKDETQDDAIMAEKAVCMSKTGNSLSLVLQ